jgi:hypothetical protein
VPTISANVSWLIFPTIGSGLPSLPKFAGRRSNRARRQILQVPVPFFFEGAPAASGVRQAAKGTADAPSPAYVTDFLATSDGLSLVKAFMCIGNPKLRRSIVRLVEEVTPETA